MNRLSVPPILLAVALSLSAGATRAGSGIFHISDLGQCTQPGDGAFGVDGASGTSAPYVAGTLGGRAFVMPGTGVVVPLIDDGLGSAAAAVNLHGVVAGTLVAPTGTHAAAWTADGTLLDLGTIGATGAATAVNESGTVAGYALAGTPGAVYRAFSARAKPGTKPADIGTLGGDTNQAFGINAKGWITGQSNTVAGGPLHAYVYDPADTAAPYTDLGTFAGKTNSSVGMAISDNGHVVGGSTIKSGAMHAFYYNGHKLRDLGTAGGVSSIATAISETAIIGTYQLDTGESRVFYASFDGEAGDIANLLDSSGDGWILESASFKNESAIVGTGTLNGVPHMFLIEPNQ